MVGRTSGSEASILMQLMHFIPGSNAHESMVY